MSSKRSDKRSSEELSRNEIKDEKFRCCSENIVVVVAKSFDVNDVVVVAKPFEGNELSRNEIKDEKFRCCSENIVVVVVKSFDVNVVVVVKSFNVNK
jgi:hypothetical protein